MAREELRNQGPWPATGSLWCDWCGREITRNDEMYAFWNPYGSFGWSVYCGPCDKDMLSRWKEIDWMYNRETLPPPK